MNAPELHKTRVFFHENRKPQVLFLVEAKIFSGHVSDLHDDGFTLVTTDDFSAVTSSTIEALFVGGTDAAHRLTELRIARARISEASGHWSLTVFLPDAETLRRFRELLDPAPLPSRPGVDASVDCTHLPRIPNSKHYTREAVEERLEWVRRTTGHVPRAIDQHAFRVESLAGNIENFVGAVQVPLGLAGPILVNGLYARGHIAVPIATTEGALVASLNRGAAALNASGGVTVHVRRQRMLRAPVFFCRDVHGAINFERWLLAHRDQVRQRAMGVSSIAQLVDLQTFVFGRTCHVQFIFETGDAAGQNMTTSCTAVACEWIRAQLASDPYVGLEDFMIEGNMSGDKKVAAQSFQSGRGVGVLAEAFVPREVLSDVLHADLELITRRYQASEVGAMQIGMVGHNVNCANVIAGVFTATGQDIASVHESALGMLKLEPKPDGIQLSLFLPSLVIGTVGGGTRLPTQQECLQLMGCAGQGKLFRLAEVIAASCLALDLSTMCAVMTNEFVAAHARLGRDKKRQRLTRSELDKHFLRRLSGRKLACAADLKSAVEVPLDGSNGVVTQVVAQRSGGCFGLIGYELEVQRGEQLEKHRAVLKLKSPHDALSRLASGIVALTGEDQLPGLFDQAFDVFGFGQSDVREVELYRCAPDAVRAFMPEVWGTLANPERELFAVLMEDLRGLSHLDTIDRPEVWTAEPVGVVLRDLAQLSAATLDRGHEICPGLIAAPSPAAFARAQPMFEELLDYQRRRFPSVFRGPWVDAQASFIEHLGPRLERLMRARSCLSHNDFNPRNLALRPGPHGGRLVAYDWELACVQSPVHDAIEFLVSALPAQTDAQQLLAYLSGFRRAMEALGGALADPADDAGWTTLLHDCAVALMLRRFNLYWLLHNAKPFGFLERITGNLRLLIEASA